MTLYLAIPFLVVVAVLQATVMPHLAVWGVFADLPILIVSSWSLLRGHREGVLWGFIGGVVVDIMSGAPFGAATLSLSGIGLLAGLGKRGVFRARITLPVALVFVLTIVYDLVFLSVVQLAGGTVVWLETLYRIILPSAALNAVLMPAVFAVLGRLHIHFSAEEIGF